MQPLDLRTLEQRKAYSEQKHYQGKVCTRKHDHGGFSWRHKGHRNCVDCNRESAAAWKKSNPERAAASTKRRDVRRSAICLRSKHPFAAHAGNVRRRARDEGLPYDITADSLKSLWASQNGLCYWTGMVLDFYVGTDRHPFRPSLDRLVPEKGYVIGNVVWSTNFANRARGDTPVDDFPQVLREFATAYRKHAQVLS